MALRYTLLNLSDRSRSGTVFLFSVRRADWPELHGQHQRKAAYPQVQESRADGVCCCTAASCGSLLVRYRSCRLQVNAVRNRL